MQILCNLSGNSGTEHLSVYHLFTTVTCLVLVMDIVMDILYNIHNTGTLGMLIGIIGLLLTDGIYSTGVLCCESPRALWIRFPGSLPFPVRAEWMRPIALGSHHIDGAFSQTGSIPALEIIIRLLWRCWPTSYTRPSRYPWHLWYSLYRLPEPHKTHLLWYICQNTSQYNTSTHSLWCRIRP